jgi:four helix bundle protein
MKDFRKLEVWQTARSLTKLVYQNTRVFPREETFGMRARMRRAAVSVCVNIAEGCGRRGDAELGRFLNIAMGSASEIECEVILASDLGFIDDGVHDALITAVVEVKRMLGGLIGVVAP